MSKSSRKEGTVENGEAGGRDMPETGRSTTTKTTSIAHDDTGTHVDSRTGQGNMYKLAAGQWNPFVGCEFDCIYCGPSFQKNAKRRRKACEECYQYTPHEHPERLELRPSRTGYGQFIFTCSHGDVSFCSDDFLRLMVARIRELPDRTFLLQSKDPATFARIDKWPANVILGTTIETNRDDLCAKASKAPPPSKRHANLMAINHPTKMVTIEPVMDFDLDTLVGWVSDMAPALVWIGYDSKKCGLQSPPLDKVRELHWQLSLLQIPVILKRIPLAVSPTAKKA
jgi:hypothetical protein